MPDTVQLSPDKVVPPTESELRNDGHVIAMFQLRVEYEPSPQTAVTSEMRDEFIKRAKAATRKSELVPGTRIPVSALSSENDLREEWERPEEDEACRRSRPAT